MPTRTVAIGLGGLGRLTLDQLATLDGFEVVAGVDIAEAPRQTFTDEFDAPAYEDIHTMLAEHAEHADAATVTTPHALHTEHVVACLEHDLHVHVEKPLTVGVEDAVRLVKMANNRNLVLQVGYQRHFHPGFHEVKRLLDRGRIGEIHSTTAFLGMDWLDATEGWRGNSDVSGGGYLYDSGSHLLDAVLWITDTQPRDVTAVLDNRGQDVDINTAIAASLEREDGTRVTASINASGDGTLFEEGFLIWGTEGHIEYRTGSITVHEAAGASYTTEVSIADDDPDFEVLVRRKLDSFRETVESDSESPVPGEHGLQVIALTEAAYEASRTGRRVDAKRLIDDARQ